MSRPFPFVLLLVGHVASTLSAAQLAPQQVLQKPAAAAGDTFGAAVALTNAALAVGAPLDDHAGGVNAGSVSLHARQGASWVYELDLVATDASAGAAYGCALALEGNVLAVGARTRDAGPALDAGAVYVYRRDAGVWTQEALLLAPQVQAGAQFGSSLALSGERLIVGAPLYTHPSVGTVPAQPARGAAYVYKRVAGQWTHQFRLLAQDGASGDRFGSAVALEGKRVLVGAPGSETAAGLVDAGAVYLYEVGGFLPPGLEWWKDSGHWHAADADAQDGFGTALVLRADVALIGAPGHEGAPPANAHGAAYVYREVSGVWSQAAVLLASDGMDQAYFGASVDVGAQRAVVGAPGHNLARGRSYVYTEAGGAWSEAQILVAQAALPKDELGGAVALDGNRVAAGARYDKLATLSNAGSTSTWEAVLTPVASATLRLPCTASAPPSSLWAPADPPLLGQAMQIRLDDPTDSAALTPGATIGLLAMCTAPAPGYPCGFVLPGLGAASGSGSELLVSLAGGDLFALKYGGAWNGPGQPLSFSHAVPAVTAILGVTLYTQGLLVDATTGVLVLSEGLDLVVGY
jgi:hypothetical protein